MRSQAAALHYYLLHPDGTLESAVLGPDLAAGQRRKLITAYTP
ncbi:cupin domain-containing protein [Seongchinamella sediminis]|nr:cupin domain-containing protein [Seongchinamella sediminis]